MKYGLNQWARISSLLVRKSAKQCKARWFEWLDPKIKKTPWSRDEDEKLLHMAKIMPTQWRTIAPIVGRTAAQCLQRYEQLLDEAAAADSEFDPKARQLPPGEIDPHPEDKPAQPDPEDMDEDEKEMLSEARARLANTKGKKAKRKAREKQLEQARRLASLQKLRELKAAGIRVGRRRRQRPRHIVPGEEIPFPRDVPKGFWDTSKDDERARQITKKARESFKPMALSELDGEFRQHKEKQLRKQDAMRQKLLKQDNLPEALKRINAMNDPQTIRHRGDLLLPRPMVTDSELEAIAKITQKPLDEDFAGATSTLVSGLGTKQQGPGQQSMRTPSSQAHLRKEAENAVALLTAKTPLLGGENPSLHESDFKGATPARSSIATPNPLGATPGINTPQGAATPGIRTPGGATPALSMGMNTPARDQMGINTPRSINDAVSTKRELKKQRKKLRERLRRGLAQLPSTVNEYIIRLPEIPTEEHVEKEVLADDQADVDLMFAKQREAARQSELKRRSQVLQRALPRPKATNVDIPPYLDDKNPALAEAAKLLRDEMVSLIQFDNTNTPVNGKPAKKKRRLAKYTDEELALAKEMLREETEKINTLRKFDPKEFVQHLENETDQCVFVPSRLKFEFSRNIIYRERVEARQQQFGVLRSHLGLAQQKEKKLRTKQEILTKGFTTIASECRKAISSFHQEICQQDTNTRIFKWLQKNEESAIPIRQQRIKKMVKQEKEREAELQLRYQSLLDEAETLQSIMSRV